MFLFRQKSAGITAPSRRAIFPAPREEILFQRKNLVLNVYNTVKENAGIESQSTIFVMIE